jgi:murein L,D-transpeptidase YcbB/YkuD
MSMDATTPTSARKAPLIAGLAAVCLVGAAGATVAYFSQAPRVQGVSPSEVSAALQQRFAADSARADAAGWHEALPAVYAARGGQPVWMDLDARAAALGLLRDAAFDGLAPDSFAVDTLRAMADAPTATDSSLAELDLRLTDALLRYGDALAAPAVDAHALHGALWFPTRRVLDAPARLRDALLPSEERPLADAVADWADGLRPQHDGYRFLRRALVREVTLTARPDLALGADLAPGDTGRAVAALRARLALEDLPAPGAAPRFDEPLATALRSYQRLIGVDTTGRLDTATRRALNRRQPELIPAMRLNLERWRWLPDSLGDLHVWVNIPAFELAVRERADAGWDEPLVSKVVVGTGGWETPVMSDTMEQIVFNPTWTIPASIQMESYGRVDPRGMVRDPGPGNPLGRVKFAFPNDHAIFIHDTPSKWSFGQDRRAFSHGCIRAGDPRDLAIALMTRVNGWEARQVEEIFDGPWTVRPEDLDRPVPVHLVYFTAVADAAGRVRVFEDVYRHDRRLAEALRIALPPPPAAA